MAAGKDKTKGTSSAEPKARNAEIPWHTHPDLTWRTIEFFTENPSFRRRYFSDSTEAAQKEDRAKTVGKDSKTSMNQDIAAYVFKTHPDYKDDYAANSTRFGTSTGQRLGRLRKAYREHVAALGATGSGLKRADVEEGTELYNAHQKILKTFPWWYELDNFWHELPNVNPIAVGTGAPGVDHAGDAQRALGSGTTEELDDDDAEEQRMIAEDPGADEDGDADSASSGSRTPEADNVSPSSESGQSRSGSSSMNRVPVNASRTSSSRTPSAAASKSAPSASAKASGSSSSAKTPASRKDKDAISKLASIREGEGERQMRKRKFENDETMARISAAESSKKAKYDYKMLRAKQKQELALAQIELNRERIRLSAGPSAAPALVPAAAPLFAGMGGGMGGGLGDVAQFDLTNVDLDFGGPGLREPVGRPF